MDVWMVQVNARAQPGQGRGSWVLLECRPSQLRTGLRAASCYAYNGLCHIVQPHVLSLGKGTWPTNLQSSIAVDPVRTWVVFHGLSFHDYFIPTWHKRGPPEPLGFYP